ncbi:MAG TPA: patatin-like phospholipase family protein [Candidatus Dormibacteraeota bacterium]|nr:patatin-like phospholipase family protein [Candidatus Dormibacteraeota bacterium]
MVIPGGKNIKVLAIDGGGIRGIIPAVILDEMQSCVGKDLWQAFDLISGTSTGGIIALGIGTKCNHKGPYSPGQLVDLYVQNGPAIFQKSFLTPERELVLPKYSPDSLEATLTQFFQDTELQTALTPLLISSYDLQRQLPFFFKSHRIAADPSYNWKVAEVARATSAAPTFFPPLHLTKGAEDYALVDGGVFVNNPSMAAYAEARALYPDAAEIVIVSVGTGDRQDQITYAAAKEWGLLGWAKEIVPVLMDSVSEAVDYELNSLPGCVYCRLQVPHLQAASSQMDDVTPQNLANLQIVAKEYLVSVASVFDKICAKLKEGRGSNMPGIGRKQE